MKKNIKRRTFLLTGLAVVAGLGVKILMGQKIRASKNFHKGRFHNISNTPLRTEGTTFFGMMKEYFFGGSKYIRPSEPLPAIKTDLNFPSTENALVWFGHSGYFIQYNGIRIAVDPAFHVPFTSKPFAGTDIYGAADLPELDFLIITHDHYDHLDKQAVKQLVGKVKHILCPLGIGELLVDWGHAQSIITEMDWQDHCTIDGVEISCFTARHTSGRGVFDQDERLWASFVVSINDYKIYIGGDSGYDTFFAEIGKTFGAIDLAILENGQYDKDWKYIHMYPSETHQATIDLKAKQLLPVHWAKYIIANHAWNEPIVELTKLQDESYELLTPMIGQKVMLDSKNQFSKWWEIV